MKFKALNGYLENSSYISISIDGGAWKNSIGDQVWISKDGKEMEVSDLADKDVLVDTMSLFEGGSRKAFKGAMMRMGVYF